MSYKLGQVCVVLGAQWGDEGKGKLVDILAEKYDIIARAAGGANAGHTIYVSSKFKVQSSKFKVQSSKFKVQSSKLSGEKPDSQKFVFHLVPSGMFHKGKICVMGNGMVVHFPTLLEEMEVLKRAGVKISGRLFLSERAHIVFDYHKKIDQMQEELKGGGKVGTTGRGIGPAYANKTTRIGIRCGELRDFGAFSTHYRQNLEILKKMYGFSHDGEEELKELKKVAKFIVPLIADTSLFLDNAFKKKKNILLEGANGTLLDIDHGTYPFVTSSNASIGGIITGSGIAANRIKSVVGIMKAYCTRVGSGPFPTELRDALGETLRTVGAEFGATTGRPRRCGWFDTVAAKYAVRINGLDAINLTKLDVLSGIKKIKIGVAYKYRGQRIAEFPDEIEVLEKCAIEYEEVSGWSENISGAKNFAALPANCKKYIVRLEGLIGVPIKFIGTGKRREEMIYR